MDRSKSLAVRLQSALLDGDSPDVEIARSDYDALRAAPLSSIFVFDPALPVPDRPDRCLVPRSWLDGVMFTITDADIGVLLDLP